MIPENLAQWDTCRHVLEFVRTCSSNPPFLACGDADAEPGARMTCRLLLHLFRAPQACLLPQATGELTADKSLLVLSFGAVGSNRTK